MNFVSTIAAISIHSNVQREINCAEMAVTKIIILMCMTSVCLSTAVSRDEIPDFEFDDSFNPTRRAMPPTAYAFDDLDDLFLEDGHEPEYDILTKEKIIQKALFRALAAKELKYKFSEVLPLLRALSKSQRMVFASIISAQLNGGKSLTLDEVSGLRLIQTAAVGVSMIPNDFPNQFHFGAREISEILRFMFSKQFYFDGTESCGFSASRGLGLLHKFIEENENSVVARVRFN